MQGGTYAVEAQIEKTHWWFVARRELMQSVLRKLQISVDIPVLDIGTSTGTNLRLLREVGMNCVVGLDMSEDAIRWCEEKGLGEVRQGDVCALPFPDQAFGLIFATDIIEHVDDDISAMAEIFRVLSPGGTVIMTVPAFQSLWGLQDEVSHHKRRYRLEGIFALARRAGFMVEENYYFNYLLFIPIWLARQVIRIFGIQLKSENELNFPVLNYLLLSIFRLDIKTSPWIKPPFGVSIMAILRKS